MLIMTHRGVIFKQLEESIRLFEGSKDKTDRYKLDRRRFNALQLRQMPLNENNK